MTLSKASGRKGLVLKLYLMKNLAITNEKFHDDMPYRERYVRVESELSLHAKLIKR